MDGERSMNSTEYMGYEFVQNDNTDRYRIYNADGQIVEHGYEKPNMTMQDAVRVIQRFMAVRDAMNEVRR